MAVIGRISINEVHIVEVDDDPLTVDHDVPVGSLAVWKGNFTNPKWYFKYGTGLRDFDALQNFVGNSISARQDWIAATSAGENQWVPVVNGGGSSTSILTNAADAAMTNAVCGIVVLNCGTNSAGRATVRGGGSVDLIKIGNGSLQVRSALYIPILSTAAQEFIALVGIGVSSDAGDGTDHIIFRYNRASSVNWICECRLNGTTTAVTTSVAVTQATWIKLRFSVNDSGTAVNFYINDSLTPVATISTNIPVTTTRAMSPGVKIRKTAGGTARTLYCDYFDYNINFTNKR